jgi:hypothetical protein
VLALRGTCPGVDPDTWIALRELSYVEQLSEETRELLRPEKVRIRTIEELSPEIEYFVTDARRIRRVADQSLEHVGGDLGEKVVEPWDQADHVDEVQCPAVFFERCPPNLNPSRSPVLAEVPSLRDEEVSAAVDVETRENLTVRDTYAGRLYPHHALVASGGTQYRPRFQQLVGSAYGVPSGT